MVKLFRLRPEAIQIAKELKTQRAIFQLRGSAESQTWLASSKEDSGYADLPGSWYHYPSHIPNGRQIAPGDVILLFRPKQARVIRSDIPELPARIFAVARVGGIEYQRDGKRKALYAAYLAVDPAVPIEAPGEDGDPRTNRRNAIGLVSPEYLSSLLEMADVALPAEGEPPLTNP
jgi:hypothetical protein